MSSGSIRYYAESKGLNLIEEFKVENIHPEVEEVTIKTESCDRLMVAIISFRDGCSKEEAVAVGDDLVDILFDQISVEQNVPIGEPRREIWVPSCGPNESLINIIEHIGISSNFQFIRDLPSGCMDIVELKEKLKSGKKEKNFYFSSYRFSIRQKDPIAKFMFLYNLLLAMVGDDQKKADELITRYQPDVEKTESPRKRRNGEPITETIYTRLRNEIAHTRTTCCPENTSDEVKVLAGQFQYILKQAVLEFSEKI